MPIDIEKEVDEVWLALTMAQASLERNGHVANSDILSCMDCHTLQLIKRAQVVYLQRAQPKS